MCLSWWFIKHFKQILALPSYLLDVFKLQPFKVTDTKRTGVVSPSIVLIYCSLCFCKKSNNDLLTLLGLGISSSIYHVDSAMHITVIRESKKANLFWMVI